MTRRGFDSAAIARVNSAACVLVSLALGLGALSSVRAEEPPAVLQPGSTMWAELKDAKIAAIQFRGNRKVEDDAIRVNLISSIGTTLDRDKIREDVRSLWKMNFFEDVHVEAVRGSSGGVTLTFVFVEKPSIRKILVQGNEELGLDKLNEVIDLKRDSILDVSRIKKNVEKVKDLYVSKGYYLATVDFQVRPVNESEDDVWLIVQENSKVQIRKVAFTGNVAVTDDELKRIMSTQEGGMFSFISDSGTYQEDAFERDLSLLTAYYYDFGYVNVKISAPHITLSDDKRFMYIDIPIDEGPPFDIGKIEFKGDLLDTRQHMYSFMETKEGSRFSRSKLGKDLVRINDLYKDAGYAYVNVSPQTIPNLDKRTIDVTFEIEKGSKVYFERINVTGNTKTRDKVIRREMKISEGELYSQTALDISKNRVTALGFFEKVDVSTKRGSSDEFIDVNVEVQEKATGTFQIGAGFSSVESFIAQAQISQNNLFGRGQVLALQAQLSGLRQIFSIRFIEPYFFDSNWTFAVDVYNQTIAQITFARNSTGGDITWGYPLSYEARLFVTYKAEEVGVNTGTSSLILSGGVVSPVSSSAVANLFRGGFTSSVRAALTWDSRNNRLFPSNGYYHNIFVEIADDWTGSQNVFVRWGGFLRHYQPLFGPFILKLNLELGVITSRLAEGVPITERYIIGGINNIRGFKDFSLSPVVLVQAPGEPSQLTQLPLGGNMELIFNSEIEFPLFAKVGISGVVFFDSGNSYNLEAKWCNRQAEAALGLSPKVDPCFSFPSSVVQGLRESVGFGFRWLSPIGPLRFEWGIPLDRQPGEDPLVFEFTIGNFF